MWGGINDLNLQFEKYFFFLIETSVEERVKVYSKKTHFSDKSQKHRAGVLGLEGKLWISERWGRERCSNKQGATGSFPLAPVSSSI